MPDDLDEGFHALVSRYATHAIRDGEALGQSHPHLAELISPPEVTFAAYLADGSIVLCCPDGLPPGLADVVEVLDPVTVPMTAPPEPEAASDEISARLDQLGKKLDRLQRDRVANEQIADRLDSLEFTILDGLARAGKREDATVATVRDVPDLAEVTRRLDALLSQVSKRPDSEALFNPDEITAAIAAAEDRMVSVFQNSRNAADLPRLAERLEEGLQKISAFAAARPDLDVLAGRLETRIETLANRPAPQGDLIAQRQGFASFMKSMGTVIRRLDDALDRISEVQSMPAIDLAMTTIDDHLDKIPERIEALLDERLDMVRLFDELNSFRSEMTRPAMGTQETAAALRQLAAQVEALAERPSPASDLAHQRQSFAGFASALGAVVQRLESVSQTIESQPGLAPLLEAIETLHVELREISPVASAQARAIDALSDQFARLAQPTPVAADVSQQRQSFAQFANAIGNAVKRLETLSDRLEESIASPKDVRTSISGPVDGQANVVPIAGHLMQTPDPAASLGAAARLEPRGAAPLRAETMQALQAVQNLLPDNLRLEVAEAIALQMKALADKQ